MQSTDYAVLTFGILFAVYTLVLWIADARRLRREAARLRRLRELTVTTWKSKRQ